MSIIAFRFGESPEPGDNGLATLPEELQQDLRRGYYASISFTDFEVGRVLDELETMGFADNTAVLFHAVRRPATARCFLTPVRGFALALLTDLTAGLAN